MDERASANVAQTHLSNEHYRAYTTRATDRSADHPYDQLMHDQRLPIAVSVMNNLVSLETNGTIFATIIAVGFFLSVAIIVVLLFEKTSIANIIANRDLTSALSLPTVTIAFIYRGWQELALKRYLEMPELYYEMLCRIRDIAECLADGVISKSHGGAQTTVTQLNAHSVARGTSGGPPAMLGVCFELLYSANDIVYRMFTNKEPKFRKLISRDLHEYLKQYSPLPVGTAEAFDLIIGLEHRAVIECDNNHVVHKQSCTTIQSNIAQLRDLRMKVSAQRVVTTPPVFETHQYLVVFVYLIFLLPVQMYQQVDLLTLFTYPVVMVLFMGPWLLTFYIGGPFSPYSRYRGMDFKMWWSSNINRISKASKRALYHFENENGLTTLVPNHAVAFA